MRYRHLLPLAAISALALGACSGSGAGSATTELPPAPTEPATADADGDEAVVLDGADAPDVADIPEEFVAAILADAAARSGQPEDDVSVVQATRVEWASQRLGCVQFDEPAEPTPVDGFRIVVSAGEMEFDYRLDAVGAFALCGDPVDASHEGDDHDEDLDDETS